MKNSEQSPGLDAKQIPARLLERFDQLAYLIAGYVLVAAALAIIGYSVNDTVVIYDRVREIELAHPELGSFEIMNRALNETMSRTIITSSTVLGVSLIMLFMGGPVIHDFFFAMTVGVVLGVYSTIFIAVPMTVFTERFFIKKNA